MTRLDASTAVNRLDALLASGLLPKAAQGHAERLKKRLRQPVRVTLMGMSGVGKSTLLNFLAGDTVLPDGVRLPTLNLRRGSVPKTICTLSDGQSLQMTGFDAADVSRQAAAFVDVALQLPALNKISLLEVVMGRNPTEQQRAISWAAARTDIAIWCTETFGPTEQSLWDAVPDELKDHSFLAMTKVDLAIRLGAFDAQLATIQESATDQFHSIFPIATLQAIGARGHDGVIDKDKLTLSGGRAIIAAILHEVEQAQQFALDSAEVLIQQYGALLLEGEAKPDVSAAIEVATTTPSITTPTSARPISSATPETLAELADAAAEFIAEADEPETTTPQSTNVVELKLSTTSFFNDSVSSLSAQAKELLEQVSDLGSDLSETVLTQCLACAEALYEQLNAVEEDDDDEGLAEARDALLDAIDLIQLMQLEDSDQASVDAVTLLLQIKRGFQAKVAA